jgi:glycosyltransferase involved in cell wall biosynthesis
VFLGKAYVKRCLTSVFSYEYSNFEVIFIDSASRGRGVKLAEDLLGSDPRFKVITRTECFSFQTILVLFGLHIVIKKTHPSAYPFYHLNEDLRERKLASHDIALFKQPAKCEKRMMG